MPILSADAHEKYMSDDVAAGTPFHDGKLPSAAPTPGVSTAARHPGAAGRHKGESGMAHMAKTANIMARNRYPPPHHTLSHHTALTYENPPLPTSSTTHNTTDPRRRRRRRRWTSTSPSKPSHRVPSQTWR